MEQWIADFAKITKKQGYKGFFQFRENTHFDYYIFDHDFFIQTFDNQPTIFVSSTYSLPKQKKVMKLFLEYARSVPKLERFIFTYIDGFNHVTPIGKTATKVYHSFQFLPMTVFSVDGKLFLNDENLGVYFFQLSLPKKELLSISTNQTFTTIDDICNHFNEISTLLQKMEQKRKELLHYFQTYDKEAEYEKKDVLYAFNRRLQFEFKEEKGLFTFHMRMLDISLSHENVDILFEQIKQKAKPFIDSNRIRHLF